MELQILTEFVALSKTCNFQETAADCNMSQANLSKHIQKLENELGVQLFDRSSRNIKLSPYGVLFSDYAQRIVQLENEALHQLRSLHDEGNNTLHIGFHPIVSQYGMVELLAKFNNLYPNFQVYTTESTYAEEMLKSFQCELFFAPDDELVTSNMYHVPFKRDRLAFICQADHPLAQEDSVPFNRLRDEKFIAHSNSVRKPSANFIKICGEAGGFVPNVVSAVSRTATIARLVSQGQGIALLFRQHLPTDIPNIVAVDIFPEVSTNISVFYYKQRRLSLTAKKFLEFLKSQE